MLYRLLYGHVDPVAVGVVSHWASGHTQVQANDECIHGDADRDQFESPRSGIGDAKAQDEYVGHHKRGVTNSRDLISREDDVLERRLDNQPGSEKPEGAKADLRERGEAATSGNDHYRRGKNRCDQ